MEFASRAVHLLTTAVVAVLIATGAVYLLPAFRLHVMRRKPPGIIGLLYFSITAWTLIRGAFLTNSEPYLQIFTELAGLQFLAGKVELQAGIMRWAASLSLYFVLANLVRSYFNLHRIEEPEPSDQFATFVSGLAGRNRWIEFSLRVSIFIAILAIESKILAMQGIVDSSESPSQRAVNFQSTLSLMWHVAVCFYAFVTVWDVFLLRRSDSSAVAVRQVLVGQALPVHICGAAVAICLSLTGHYPDLADLLTHFAIVFSCLGLFFLSRSLWSDRRIFADGFRWRSEVAPSAAK